MFDPSRVTSNYAVAPRPRSLRGKVIADGLTLSDVVEKLKADSSLAARNSALGADCEILFHVRESPRGFCLATGCGIRSYTMTGQEPQSGWSLIATGRLKGL